MQENREFLESLLPPSDLAALLLTARGEAWGQPEKGVAAVMMTIIHRAYNPRWWTFRSAYPASRSLAAAALKPAQYSCWDQQADLKSFLIDGNIRKGLSELAWQDVGVVEMARIATELYRGQYGEDPAEGCTHYYAPKAMRGATAPRWAFEAASGQPKPPQMTLDGHVFYRPEVVDGPNAKITPATMRVAIVGGRKRGPVDMVKDRGTVGGVTGTTATGAGAIIWNYWTELKEWAQENAPSLQGIDIPTIFGWGLILIGLALFGFLAYNFFKQRSKNNAVQTNGAYQHATNYRKFPERRHRDSNHGKREPSYRSIPSPDAKWSGHDPNFEDSGNLARNGNINRASITTKSIKTDEPNRRVRKITAKLPIFRNI